MSFVYNILLLGCVAVFIYRLINNKPLKPIVGWFLIIFLLDYFTYYLFYYGTGIAY